MGHYENTSGRKASFVHPHTPKYPMVSFLQRSDNSFNQELLKSTVKNIKMKLYGPMNQILETLSVHILEDSSVYTEKYYFSHLSYKDGIWLSHTKLWQITSTVVMDGMWKNLWMCVHVSFWCVLDSQCVK